MAEDAFRLAAITLDERSIVRRTREIEQERDIAIYDILEDNSFRPEGSHGGPYKLVLSVDENRLVFDIQLEDDTQHGKVMLSLTPLRRVIKDYFLVCESYYEAIRGKRLGQVEAIDVGRRSLHDEGSALLIKRLADKVAIDHPTARRLFTLICVLHLRV